MNNFIQPGDVLEFTAPAGGVTSGAAVLLEGYIVIPAITAAVGVIFSGQVVGVFSVAKVSAQAWTKGARIYWDNGAALFTTVSTNNLLAGAATAAAVDPSSTGKVRLNGFAHARLAANADTSGAALAALETEVNEIKASLRSAGIILP